MLGSTHGTLTTDSRRARVIACGEQRPGPAVHDRAADLDVSGRPLHADVPDLTRFFRPRSLAVVGASDTEGRPNTGITRQLLDWAGRVGARVHPVHPRRPSVFGLPCASRVADLPEEVDLAVLLVADPLPLIGELAEAKVRFAVAFASGFAETGRRAPRHRSGWPRPYGARGCGCSARTPTSTPSNGSGRTWTGRPSH